MRKYTAVVKSAFLVADDSNGHRQVHPLVSATIFTFAIRLVDSRQMCSKEIASGYHSLRFYRYIKNIHLRQIEFESTWHRKYLGFLSSRIYHERKSSLSHVKDSFVDGWSVGFNRCTHNGPHSVEESRVNGSISGSGGWSKICRAAEVPRLSGFWIVIFYCGVCVHAFKGTSCRVKWERNAANRGERALAARIEKKLKSLWYRESCPFKEFKVVATAKEEEARGTDQERREQSKGERNEKPKQI